jgi:2-dehydro-3-deoxyphosphooctonate aldolase (KDO 8-P synthase)
MTKTRKIKIGEFEMGSNLPLVLFAGPNVVEPVEMCLRIAEKSQEIAQKFGFPYVYKSSYYKPNRTDYGPDVHSQGYRGPGLESALETFREIKEKVGVPIVTDVHSAEEAIAASEVCDVLQIPAANSKHMDIILAAGSTGKAVKIKKGQWLSPWEMTNVVNQLLDNGYNDVMVTERGTFFGYKNLVMDIKSIPILKTLGVPVVWDCAHSIAFAEGNDHFLGKVIEYIPFLARAGISAGADGFFIEVHPEPSKALTNPQATYPLDKLHDLLEMLKPFADAAEKIRS